MKVLIIDNGTSYLPKVEKLLEKHSFQVVKCSEIKQVDYSGYDCVILSGGHNFPVFGNEDILKEEMEFIKNCTKPIFGICFGFESIARTFGAKLEIMDSKERGIVDIQVVEPDKIFVNIPNFQVFESHRWVVREPINEFKVLARSKDGVEVIKHKNKPIYAVQFHPEMFMDQTCGDECFNNFLNSVV